jgi:8-oxo-dGTP diphosphatase
VPDGPRGVAALIAAIEPFGDTERSRQADALAWLASTPDVYRRIRPATPPRHMVSYAVLTDPRDWSMFLVDHRLAGLWLPAGGHVEPGEEPAVTAAREAREELGVDADFLGRGLDPREFAGGHWWTGPQIESADPALLDPNMGRFLAKIRGQPRA